MNEGTLETVIKELRMLGFPIVNNIITYTNKTFGVSVSIDLAEQKHLSTLGILHSLMDNMFSEGWDCGVANLRTEIKTLLLN